MLVVFISLYVQGTFDRTFQPLGLNWKACVRAAADRLVCGDDAVTNGDAPVKDGINEWLK